VLHAAWVQQLLVATVLWEGIGQRQKEELVLSERVVEREKEMGPEIGPSTEEETVIGPSNGEEIAK